MRIKHGILKELSEKTGKSITLLSDYASGRKRAGRQMARTLAINSGVPESIWQYSSSEEIKAALNKSMSN